jgi:hypothetical protein
MIQGHFNKHFSLAREKCLYLNVNFSCIKRRVFFPTGKMFEKNASFIFYLTEISFHRY